MQRVDEGPAVRVHPCAFTVRKVTGSLSPLSGGVKSAAMTTAEVFPSLPQTEQRFLPRITVSTGAPGEMVQRLAGERGSGMTPMVAPAAINHSPLTLYEYATVDFFIEAPGCPTETDFLRLDTCVDVPVSGVGGAGRSGDEFVALPVALTEGSEHKVASGSVAGLVTDDEKGRLAKRRVGIKYY